MSAISLSGCLQYLFDKVAEGKEELRDSNSQLKYCINDLKMFACTLEETRLL
jgi:hypothetical protein